MAITIPKMYTLKEVAETSGLSYATCKRAAKSGMLQGCTPYGMKRTFYTAEAVKKWLEGAEK